MVGTATLQGEDPSNVFGREMASYVARNGRTPILSITASTTPKTSFFSEKKPRKQRIEDIAQIIEEEGGSCDLETLSIRTGLSPETLMKRYIPKDGVRRVYNPRVRKTRAENVDMVRAVLERGVRSIEELYRKTELRPSTIYYMCLENGIDYPVDAEPYPHRPKMDKGIEKGLTLKKIGRLENVSKQAAEQYVIYSGQYRAFRQKRLAVEMEEAAQMLAEDK